MAMDISCYIKISTSYMSSTINLYPGRLWDAENKHLVNTIHVLQSWTKKY
jgi:hypothetical protein